MTTLSEAIARLEDMTKYDGCNNLAVAMQVIRQQQRMAEHAVEWLNKVSYLLPVEDCIKILSTDVELAPPKEV